MAAAWIGGPDPLAGPVPATTVNGGSDLTVTNTTLLEHCLLEMADAAAGAGDGTADALGGAAEADFDALADDLEAQLVSRDSLGRRAAAAGSRSPTSPSSRPSESSPPLAPLRKAAMAGLYPSTGRALFAGRYAAGATMAGGCQC